MRPHSIHQRFCGLLLLVVYLAGQLPGLALMAAGLALSDGDHSVTLFEGRGGLHLVLGHEMQKQCPEVRHEHTGLVALLVGPGGGEHPDHEFVFGHAASSLADNKKAADGADPAVKQARPAILAGWLRFDGVGAAGFDTVQRLMPDVALRWWPPAPRHDGWGAVCRLI
jgi:hypothetical protein